MKNKQPVIMLASFIGYGATEMKRDTAAEIIKTNRRDSSKLTMKKDSIFNTRTYLRMFFDGDFVAFKTTRPFKS